MTSFEIENQSPEYLLLFIIIYVAGSDALEEKEKAVLVEKFNQFFHKNYSRNEIEKILTRALEDFTFIDNSDIAAEYAISYFAQHYKKEELQSFAQYVEEIARADSLSFREKSFLNLLKSRWQIA